MTDKQKRAQEVILSAEKAIAKITDPALRAKAVAKLEATRKQISKGTTASTRISQQRARDHDFDR